MKEIIRWSPDEWKTVASKAAKIKNQFPDWGWLKIVPQAQDDLEWHRRRSCFASNSSLRPLFNILGLDEKGQPKVEPVQTPELTQPPAQPPLTDVPLSDLAHELFKRLDKLMAIESVVTDLMDMATRTESRMTAIEDLVLIEPLSQREKPCATSSDILGHAITEIAPATTETAPVEPAKPDVAKPDVDEAKKVKIVIVGLMPEQFQRVKAEVNKMVPEKKLELMWLDKDHNLPSAMPVVDWCIVGRHTDHTIINRCKSRYNKAVVWCDTSGTGTIKQHCLNCYSRSLQSR